MIVCDLSFNFLVFVFTSIDLWLLVTVCIYLFIDASVFWGGEFGTSLAIEQVILIDIILCG